MTEKVSLEALQPSLATIIRRYVETLVMVAAVTLIGKLMAARWGKDAVDLLYLLPVLAAAIFYGLGPALLAAIVSTLAYNFFFTQPLHSFQIDRPADLVTVAILFVVAFVTSQLAARMREQARRAAANATRNAAIAGFAGRLVSCSSEAEIAQVACEEIARLFDCSTAQVTGSANPHVTAIEPGAASVTPADLVVAASVIEEGKAAGRGSQRLTAAEWQFHPVRSKDKILAAIGVAREDGTPPVREDQQELFASLLDQVALALERARADRKAREAAALHERDSLRFALLCSIGDDVKPRLNTITASARALLRDGSADKTLASSLVTEAGKLGRYIDNLVDLSPGSIQKPIEVESVVIDLHNRIVTNAGTEVHLTPKEYAVLAELAKHAGRVLTHAQLLRTVWGPAQQGHIDYLRVAIRSLRQKLESDPAKPELIINEPAVGYRLALPVDSSVQV